MEYEYKVIDVADGSISSVLLGEGRIETAVLEAYLNAMAAEGWRLADSLRRGPKPWRRRVVSSGIFLGPSQQPVSDGPRL